MIRLLTLLFLLFPAVLQAETLRMAVTTSFHNSGLSDVLLPAIRDDTGLEVQLLVVGTGQALRLGRAGDVDAILVHSKAAEEDFVAQGFAPHRRQIMYNDFVIIGPATDPLALATLSTAAEAFGAIAAAEPAFVSRGDDSGTHKKERSLWSEAGLDPDSFGPWYREVGAGMGASLNTASALGALTLSDRASWLKFQNKRDLGIVFEGDAALFNQYSFLPVSAARHPHVKAKAAETLEAWLTGPRAQSLINGYRLDGQTLFTFNAEP